MAQRTLDKIGLAFIERGRLLVVRKAETQLFLMPGGKREGVETDAKSLAREILEETGGTLVAASLEYLGEFVDEAANDPECLVRIRLYAGAIAGELSASSEIAELKWWDAARDEEAELSAIIRFKILPHLRHTGALPEVAV
jgi:8-oxo-dGTP diphosphatase